MRVDFATYSKLERATRLRAALLFAGAAVVGLGSILLAALSLLFTVVADLSFDQRIVFLAMAGFFALPTAGAAAMLAKGRRMRARLAELHRVALLVRRLPAASSSDVARELGVDLAAAERALFDACVAGVFVDDGAQNAVTAPAAPGPQGVPAPVAPTDPPPVGPPVESAPALRRGRRAAPWHSGPSEAATALDRTISGALLNGTYQIEGPLGAGAMGVVYTARQVRTGRRYAVKALVPGARPSAVALRRFKREAEVLSALGHPGIVAVHDFDVSADGVAFMVMDLLEGETLAARLGWQGSLAWGSARTVARQLCAALAAAHGAGVLHRDLKPSNVFLCPPAAAGEPERAVLLDFGLAKPLDGDAASALTLPQQVLGTPLYMAPEQARGEPVDQRTDVYGLGAVLYEMVTGAPPFLDASLARLYARLLDEPPPRASDAAVAPLPAEADQLLERALAKDPAQRFQTADDFLDALDRVPEA